MSGKFGDCSFCGISIGGIYTMDVCRGWHGDKYNFSVEICESCVEKIANTMKSQPKFEADTIYVQARKELYFGEEKDY